MVNLGYGLQDHLESYDFVHGHEHQISPDDVWKEVQQQNAPAAKVRELFPRTARHPLVALVVCMAVAVVDVRIVQPVQDQIHRGDAEHGHVEIEAEEHAFLQVPALVGIELVARVNRGLVALVVFALDEAGPRRVGAEDVFRSGGQEAARATRRVADHVGRLGADDLDHHPDDVPRRAELAVDAGGGELAQQVLVQVALRVAVFDGQPVDPAHGRDEQAGLLDQALGVGHVLAEGGAGIAHAAEVRKDLLADDFQHLRGRFVLEAAPA